MRNFIPIYAVLIVCVLVIGCASKEITPEPVEMSTAPAVSLLIAPAEKLTSGEPVEFSVIGFDVDGKQTGASSAYRMDISWLDGYTSRRTLHTR